MLKFMKNEILKMTLILLVMVGVGLFTNLVEEPDKNWVYDQVIEHGTMLDISEDEVAFRVDGEEHMLTWKEAKIYFEGLND